MTITINGTTGITTPEVTLDNSTADGGQVVLKSSGYSNWNLDNYSGRFRGYYGSTEYFTVDASGNMGIGTSSPANKLDVNGVNISLKVAANNGGIQLVSSENSTNTGYVAFFNGTSRAGYLGYGDTTNGLTFASDSATNIPIRFVTNGSERARIDTSGNLLVACTSNPTVGATSGSGFAVNTGGLFTQNVNNAGAVRYVTKTGGGSTNTYFDSFWYQGTNVGWIISTNGTTLSYQSASDYRLKEDVRPMTGALEKVAALKPCTYKWKSNGSDGQGFIAHELAEVVPDAVSGEKDAVDADGNPVYQGIDTSFLVATLTAAIQELKAELDATKAEVAALKGQQA